MTDLVLVRHGQTQANVVGRWHGWSDHPLTPVGRAQAKAVARRLAPRRGSIAALYTSPLRRALQTAQIIGNVLGLDPITMHQLKEINFGELNGVSLEEMEAQYPALYARWQDKTDMTFQWPGGERRADFFRRVADACDRILARHPSETVTIVGHGGTIRACLGHLLPDELGQWWRYSLDNCGVSRVKVEESGAQLLVLNDTDHLRTREKEDG